MPANHKRTSGNLMIAILAIVGVSIALIILLWGLVGLCSLLWAGLSYGFVAFIEMNRLWSTNVWTSIYYLGQVIIGLGLLIILILLMLWIGRYLIKWGQKSYHFIQGHLGGIHHD